MYSTLEPCAMCMGAIQASRIKRLVYGAKDLRLGACGSWVDLHSAVHPFHSGLEISSGVRADESALLLRRFFQDVRLAGSVADGEADGAYWSCGRGSATGGHLEEKVQEASAESV